MTMPIYKLNRTDHELLLHVELMMQESIEDRKRLNRAMFGDDGTNGVVGWVQQLKTQMAYVLIVGSGIVGAIGWLVVLHVKP
jgi:hypothetical protein